MTKAEDKLQEVQQKVEIFKTEADKRADTLNKLIQDLRTDIEDVKEREEDSSDKIGKLNNEIKLSEQNIQSEKDSIASLNSELGILNPDLESKHNKRDQLKETLEENKSKRDQLVSDIESSQTKKANLTTEVEEKREALADLEASIDKDLEKYHQELDEVKAELSKVNENNIIWDYMFDILETPEIEIMAIIAANREISQDQIKSKAKGVSPVFVGRAISKLEADGKIVNKDNNWDLSSSLLDVIND